MIENSNTVTFGSRRWSASRATTPAAAPKPSAAISAPKVALSPPSALRANTGPSGIIAPPPISARPRPMMIPRTRGWLRMKCKPSLMSRSVPVQSTRRPRRCRSCGIGRRTTISAETTNVSASTSNAKASWSSSMLLRKSNEPSQAARAARSEKHTDASGKVANDATSDNVFAEGSCSVFTRCGTDASFAGPHNSVMISSANETATSPARLSMKGRTASKTARPTSQVTITRRRSNRSMMTPPTVPSRKPGITRAAITKPTAAPELCDTRAAIARIAIKPTQSPVLEVTCASHSRKYERVPKTRHGAGGTGDSSGRDGMNGAGWLTAGPAYGRDPAPPRPMAPGIRLLLGRWGRRPRLRRFLRTG